MYWVCDLKGNVIFKWIVVISVFGIVFVDCLLVSEIFLGVYEVECEVGLMIS